MANQTDQFFSTAVDTNDLANAGNRARVAGSTFTVFTWQNNPITFARQISYQSAAPVGPGTVPIHPMDSPYPVELITPMATTMGTIVLELYELYGQYVWQRLFYLGGQSDIHGGEVPVDLANIFQAVANSDRPIHIYRVIRPPRLRGKTLSPYTEEFHNCVVSSLDDGETIEIGTMEVLKRLTVNYTHITRGGQNTLLKTATGLPGASNPTGTVFR